MPLGRPRNVLFFFELSDQLVCRGEEFCRQTGDPLLFPLGLLALCVRCGRLFDFSDTLAALSRRSVCLFN
jgi:hypothetical protein